MAASVELDPVFRQALKCLHSPNSDAAESIRKALDEVIKQKHGSNKMLINTLSKKYISEERNSTGSGVVKAIRRSSTKSSDSSSNSSPVQHIATTKTTTVITTDSSGQAQEIPVIISLPDTMTNATIAAVDDNAMDTNIHNSLFDELSCIICRRIDVSAKNSLIECIKCEVLYHQDCHTPQIKDSDLVDGQESSWCCSNCKVKKFKSSHSIGSPSKSNNSSSPTSSNSSNSDVIITGSSGGTFTSSGKKDKEHSSSSSNKSKSSSSSSSRHHSHHHHHHHSSKHERTSEKSSEKNSSGGNSKSAVTPNIHIISADKRLQNMKKKAAKSQESKRKK